MCLAFGDLRRALESIDDIKMTTIDDLMTKNYHSVTDNELAYEVLNQMRTNAINSMPVFDQKGELVGALNMHDILRARL